MKKLFKNLPVVFMTLALSAGCGKEQTSGDGPTDPKTNVDDVTQITGSSINEIRSAFENRSMADGIPGEDLIVQHTGSFFKASTGQTSSGGGDCNLKSWSNFANCLNIKVGVEVYTGTQLEVIMEATDIKKVVSANQDSVSYQVPVAVIDNAYDYENSADPFSRDSRVYREMLSLGNNPIEVRTSPATIEFAQGGSKPATLVEYFYGYKDTATGRPIHQTVRRFVLSTNLPIIANPVLALNQYMHPAGKLMQYGTSRVGVVSFSKSHQIEVKTEQTNYGYRQYTVLKAVTPKEGYKF